MSKKDEDEILNILKKRGFVQRTKSIFLYQFTVIIVRGEEVWIGHDCSGNKPMKVESPIESLNDYITYFNTI